MKAAATFSLLITSVLASPLLVERRQDPMELHEEHGSSGGENDNIISGFFGQIRGLVGSTAKTFGQITGFDLGSDADSYDAESSRESDKGSEPGGGHSHGSGDEHDHSSEGGHGSGGHGSSSGGGHRASVSEDESISFGVDASDYGSGRGSGRGYGSRSGRGHGARKPKDESLGFGGDVAKHSSGGHAPSGGSGHGIDDSFNTSAGSDFDPNISNDTEDNYSTSGRGAGSKNGSSGHNKSHMSASPPYDTIRGKAGYGKTNKITAQVRSASANDDDLFNDKSEFDMETKSLDNKDDFGDSSSHKKGEDSQSEQSGGFFSSIGLGSVPILGQY